MVICIVQCGLYNPTLCGQHTQTVSDYRGCWIIKQLLLWSNIATCVRLQRLSDYQVTLTMVYYNNMCQIKEVVGLSSGSWYTLIRQLYLRNHSDRGECGIFEMLHCRDSPVDTPIRMGGQKSCNTWLKCRHIPHLQCRSLKGYFPHDGR